MDCIPYCCQSFMYSRGHGAGVLTIATYVLIPLNYLPLKHSIGLSKYKTTTMNKHCKNATTTRETNVFRRGYWIFHSCSCLAKNNRNILFWITNRSFHCIVSLSQRGKHDTYLFMCAYSKNAWSVWEQQFPFHGMMISSLYNWAS